MKTYNFIYIILLLILGIELIKCYNSIEYFSSYPTDNRLSNNENSKISDKFAADDEEILIMTQEPDGTRKMEFTNIKTRLNKWVIIIVKSKKTGNYNKISNFQPIQIKQVNYEIMNLLGQNKFIFSDGSTLFYYIKFLSDKGYQNEIKKIGETNKSNEKYKLCLKDNAGLPKLQIINRCSNLT